MHKATLFEEYRLIEKGEAEVNGAWRGAHLLLFFMAFVFGSFCTFCFHMLMYLFDEKCVLFPKLLSLTSTRHNVIYEFIPSSKELQDMPVDFLSTQWIEKNACTLPTYVPLLSGIFGLVWTTMFLMCSTASRTLTGLQRPWRVLPPIFLFSLAMGSLCVYSSVVTHYGLQELCSKLGEITGSSTCSYTVNVVTLAYERRIRGVYQATRLTILTAWLHTACWILSALLALARVILVVDFQLVRINVDLRGDIDKMLQRHEQQIRTVSPEPDVSDVSESTSSTKVHFKRKAGTLDVNDEQVELQKQASDIMVFSNPVAATSELTLIPDTRIKLARLPAYKNVPTDKHFIVHMLYDILDTISVAEMLYKSVSPGSSLTSESKSESKMMVSRQIGQERILSNIFIKPSPVSAMSAVEAEELATEIKHMLQRKLISRLSSSTLAAALTLKNDPALYNYMSDELRLVLELEDFNQIEAFTEEPIEEEKNTKKKSNLKSVGIQTDKPKGKVQISKSLTDSTLEYVSSVRSVNVDKIFNANVDKMGVDKATTDEKHIDEDVEMKESTDSEDTIKEDVDKNHDGEKKTVFNVQTVKKDVDNVIFENEDNAEKYIKENTDLEVLNIDQLTISKANSDLEVAEKVLVNKQADETVAKKEDVNIQVDIKSDVIDIERKDDEVVNIESVGEVNVDEQIDSNFNKKTQTKPKEKQD